MIVNRDEFFREVTRRICSSLNLETALRNAFVYLRDFFPMDDIYLDILDQNLGAIRRIAHVVTVEETAHEEIVPVPEGLWEWLRKKRKPFIVLPSDRKNYIRAIDPMLKFSGNSDLVLPLQIEGEVIGLLVLRARGDGRYSSEHIDLLATVSEPFAIALANALAHQSVVKYRDTLIDDNRYLKKELLAQAGDEIVGGNSGMRNVMEMVRQIASLNNTVLLMGETGTGKELIANAIHFASPRKDGPFIKVNCGAIPIELIDSELFGHERGAFTGATAEKRGRFERADGGTIFLDEIGELPPQAQVRLLRVLQNREVERVGGNKPISVDIRVIAATHRNLEGMVSENRFREDLWFRLNVFPIILPPLRQRKEDIPPLVRHFIAHKSREMGIAVPPGIAPGALDRLMNYSWPGNVREMENLVEREIIRNRGGQLMFDTLHAEAVGKAGPGQGAGAFELPLALDEAMASHISRVLKIANGRINGPGGAAELLKINANTLRGRMRKLGISYGRGKR
ncbi:sigma 54-interacting transcriptional regulator [Geobacter argillaceus]|uniref:Transcriptional regulator with GAF, ATPase, and Fis domain n=1 Tax=Geobacter argillaceus TaxID=345631 RepID=A0A562V8Y0_9BACT|nr:sigma 54-interacting transcriptional regulator [Geobacter argillaceus]TWJ14187.1 transcriptional regulator with GAF, ATPase, and Fis domain [Geobacter argillaceus]